MTIAVEDSTLCCCNLDVGSAHFDEGVVGVEILPESGTLDGYLGTFLQLRQVDRRVSRHRDAVQDDVGARCHSGRDGRERRHMTGVSWRACSSCGQGQ